MNENLGLLLAVVIFLSSLLPTLVFIVSSRFTLHSAQNFHFGACLKKQKVIYCTSLEYEYYIYCIIAIPNKFRYIVQPNLNTFENYSTIAMTDSVPLIIQ